MTTKSILSMTGMARVPAEKACHATRTACDLEPAMSHLTTHPSKSAKLSIVSMILCSFLLNTGAQTNSCESPPSPTFTVFLPKLGFPPDEEGQGWDRPLVWGDRDNEAVNETITVPNGRPIYALIVSGYASNRYLDELMVYNFARHLMANRAYVHFAWWNNLLAPYMERPLHHSQSYAGDLAEDQFNFVSAEAAAEKAFPGEDYQFVADAKRFLSAIRAHNPSAMIIVVGHSMGGGAVVHLGSQANVVIDILAPIDAVGNRNYPWGGAEALLLVPVPPYANWTRWRVTRDNFLGFQSADWQGIRTGCVPVDPFLKDITERSNDFRCPGLVFYHDAPTLRFGSNVINLFYRYQKEFLFPFDFRQDYGFLHTRPPGGSTSQAEVPMTPQYCGPGGLPPRCADPGGWPAGGDEDAACCTDGSEGVGWPRDGHGEIVGYRGPAITGKPVPLAVRLRVSPQCGADCFGLAWPSRSQSSDGTWSNGNGAARVARLQELETLAAGARWTHEPTNPHLCLVSPGLISLFNVMNKPPIANAGGDQILECTGQMGAEVVLDGSASSDPDNDALEYRWEWPFGSSTSAVTTVTLPLGVHCITLTVRDLSGHIDRDVISVTVQDTTPPELTVGLTPRLLWPANHKLRTISATVQARDLCGQVTELELVSIISNQPDNDRGDGNTVNDIQEATFDTLDLTFKLRAERTPQLADRKYTVTYQATDDSGNRAEVSVDVIVPHDANSYKNWRERLSGSKR